MKDRNTGVNVFTVVCCQPSGELRICASARNCTKFLDL
jgi:hypothetical protein